MSEIERICSYDPSLLITDDGTGNIGLSIDRNQIYDSFQVNEKVINVKNEVISEIDYKIDLIEKKYENQLQRTKVHISRGGRVTGSKIHGRRYKVTIPKRSFRNQTSIIGCPSGTK